MMIFSYAAVNRTERIVWSSFLLHR